MIEPFLEYKVKKVLCEGNRALVWGELNEGHFVKEKDEDGKEQIVFVRVGSQTVYAHLDYFHDNSEVMLGEAILALRRTAKLHLKEGQELLDD